MDFTNQITARNVRTLHLYQQRAFGRHLLYKDRRPSPARQIVTTSTRCRMYRTFLGRN
ncbi:hypothetical protein RvY_17057 [Ramazzottius varieornatus]|uniref:Uncharacterized protein n=1 Tax=Ramazzottius varieornatus TaxID=947166 RepID=A0A1D1W6X5_RAMVA|nr:hypothetical protein RvY_17057 [Ramazzottius varieornatus]